MHEGKKYEVCKQGLADFAAQAGFTDALIGLSGGIDSSVTAALCVHVFGAEHVHGVMLPGPYSSGHSVDDARTLADNLGIEATVISILEPFEAFEKVLAQPCGGELRGLASENTQARCRMVCLMALSNRYGWMLVNTGNKSEAMMGYSTLYGDTAGAYAPLGGLYKTDVYEVGRYCNRVLVEDGVCDIAPIPLHVFEKPPSAELAPGQSDERSMGIDYASLDHILISYFERDLGLDALAAEGVDVSEAARVVETVNSYAFKRALEPEYPFIDYSS